MPWIIFFTFKFVRRSICPIYIKTFNVEMDYSVRNICHVVRYCKTDAQ